MGQTARTVKCVELRRPPHKIVLYAAYRGRRGQSPIFIVSRLPTYHR